MPEKRRRSPAEKKALSYEKDRRNAFMANDKASRKGIPLSKAKGHRADRRKSAAALSDYENLDEEKADLVENALVNDVERIKRWKKCPDQSLADHIETQEFRRDQRDGRKQWVRENVEEAKAKGHTSFGHSWRGSPVESSFDSE